MFAFPPPTLMMFFKILSSLALAQLAVAQGYGGGPAPSNGAPTTSAPPAIAPSAPPNTPGHINVNVAPNNQFVFSPNNFSANVGDIVTFYFPGGSTPHSVTQSTFSEPCTYAVANGSTPAGFDSTLQLGTAFSLNITSQDSIWFHCKQVGHCGMGMVGSINAPATGNTYAAFLANAIAIGGKEVNQPDSATPTPVLSGIGAIATGPPSVETSSPNTTSGAEKIVVKGSPYLAIAGVVMWMI